MCRPATSIVILRRHGGRPIRSRFPLALRQWLRFMLALVHILSMNTGRSGSRSLLGSEPRLPLFKDIGTVLIARVTGLIPARDLMTSEKPPRGAERDADAQPRKVRADFSKRHFARLFRQISADTGLLANSRRTLVSTRLSGDRAAMLAHRLSLADRVRNAHSRPRRRDTTARTAINRRDDPIAQILRQCISYPGRTPSPAPDHNLQAIEIL